MTALEFRALRAGIRIAQRNVPWGKQTNTYSAVVAAAIVYTVVGSKCNERRKFRNPHHVLQTSRAAPYDILQDFSHAGAEQNTERERARHVVSAALLSSHVRSCNQQRVIQRLVGAYILVCAGETIAIRTFRQRILHVRKL